MPSGNKAVSSQEDLDSCSTTQEFLHNLCVGNMQLKVFWFCFKGTYDIANVQNMLKISSTKLIVWNILKLRISVH